MNIESLAKELNTNTYPGRGIVLGKSKDGKKAVIAYFIMGRSVNSRNRIFEENDRGGIRTKAFDESKMEDPSLIIYNPVLKFEDKTIVTNGDQTDTIYDCFANGKCYIHALRTREFEPDAPNYTPRISGVVKPNGDYNLSILKSNNGEPQCVRCFFEYPQVSDTSSTHISVTVIRFRHLRASRLLLKSAMKALTISPRWFGITSTRTTRFLFSLVISTLKQVQRKQELLIKTTDYIRRIL